MHCMVYIGVYYTCTLWDRPVSSPRGYVRVCMHTADKTQEGRLQGSLTRVGMRFLVLRGGVGLEVYPIILSGRDIPFH